MLNNPTGRPPADRDAVAAWAKYRSLLVGRQPELAKALGISQPAISKWDQVPELHLDIVADFLDVAPDLLRPDLYDPWVRLDGPTTKDYSRWR